MLENIIASERPDYLATYTRNPAIVRMIRGVSDTVYPLTNDQHLKVLATEMPGAVEHESVYHIDRYPPEGLFRGQDPADRPLDTDGASLKELYPQLISARNALIVVARMRKEHA